MMADGKESAPGTSKEENISDAGESGNPNHRFELHGSVSSETMDEPSDAGKRSLRPSKSRGGRPPRHVSVVEPDVSVRDTLGDNEFVVERVLAYKYINRVRYARVKWRGFRHTSWEPVDSIFYVNPAEIKKPSVKAKEERERERLKAEQAQRRRAREVDRVMTRAKRRGKMQCRVRWKGYPKVPDSWIDEDKLNRPDHVHHFNKKLKGTSTPPKFSEVFKRARGRPPKDPLFETDLEVPAGTGGFYDESIRKSLEASFPPPLPAGPLFPQTETPAQPSPTLSQPPVIMKFAKALISESVDTLPETSFAPKTLDEFSQKNVKPTLNGTAQTMRISPPTNRSAHIPEGVVQWSVDDVVQFLRERGFEEAAVKMWESKVDGKVFSTLTDPSSVQKYDMPLGPSLKISKLVKELRALSVSLPNPWAGIP